jgi:hypothetical protein
MPPPIISLIAPNNIIIALIIIPATPKKECLPLDTPITHSIKPKIATGIFSQFSQPRNGMIDRVRPIPVRIPIINPSMLILFPSSKFSKYINNNTAGVQ